MSQFQKSDVVYYIHPDMQGDSCIPVVAKGEFHSYDKTYGYVLLWNKEDYLMKVNPKIVFNNEADCLKMLDDIVNDRVVVGAPYLQLIEDEE